MLAPVIIPTLNRNEHLKQCITSLQNNKLAKETDLYISVDYPPAEKYREGYEKVLKYLEGKIVGFKNVYIYYQKNNLGPSENSVFLQKIVLEKYEKYIYTEDDNIFSPNFLEYMNQCLEKYKDDETIFAIGGYSYPIHWSDDRDAIIKQSMNFTAWGYGAWKEKNDKEICFSRAEIFDYLKNFHNAKVFYRNNRVLFNHAVYIASGKHYLALLDNGDLRHIDAVKGIYMFINKKSMILPALSKVRNAGHDGSGQNCKGTSKNDNTSDGYNFAEQEIDLSSEFNLNESKILDVNQSHVKQLNRYFNVPHKTMIKVWIIWFLRIWLKRTI